MKSLSKFQQEVDGPLQGGNPGVRIVDAPSVRTYPSHGSHGNREPGGSGDLLFITAYHVFGSEELSARSEQVACRAPAPYVGLGEWDAEWLRVTEGQVVRVTIGHRTIILAMRAVAGLPEGLAVLPLGLPGFPYCDLPARGALSPDREKGEARGE